MKCCYTSDPRGPCDRPAVRNYHGSGWMCMEHWLVWAKAAAYFVCDCGDKRTTPCPKCEPYAAARRES